MYNKHVCALK